MSHTLTDSKAPTDMQQQVYIHPLPSKNNLIIGGSSEKKNNLLCRSFC